MSTPSARTPSEKAAESSTPVSRMSRATRICGASGEAGHGPADGPAHVGIELVGHRAAHVVRLEDLVHAAHRAPP